MVTALRPSRPLPLPDPAASRLFLLRAPAFTWLGLRALLATTPGLALVGEAETAAQVLATLPALAPQLLVLPGDLAGCPTAPLVAQLRAQLPALRVLVLLEAATPAAVASLGTIPIDGCLVLADLTPDQLVATVRAILADDLVVEHRAVRAARSLRSPLAPVATLASGLRLSPREAAVVALLAEDLADHTIAARLGLSPSTVRTHIRNASALLGAQTRVGLALAAAAAGLIALPVSAATPVGERP